MKRATEELTKILVPTKRSANDHGAEKRKTPRVSVRAWINVSDNDDDSDPIEVHLLDISRFGVGFIDDQQHQIGAHLIVYLPTSEEPLSGIVGKIVHCRAMSDSLFNIGVQFTEPLAER